MFFKNRTSLSISLYQTTGFSLLHPEFLVRSHSINNQGRKHMNPGSPRGVERGTDGIAACDYLAVRGPKLVRREAVHQHLGQVLLIIFPRGQHRHVCHILY